MRITILAALMCWMAIYLLAGWIGVLCVLLGALASIAGGLVWLAREDRRLSGDSGWR